MAKNEDSSRAAIEHGSSKSQRYLRENRYKLALILVLVESVVIAFGSLTVWLAIVVGACLLVLYLLWREHLSGSARELAWIVAASQAVGVLVFIFALVALVLVIGALVVLALVTLGALLIERR
ncbi:MAG: hypothetical protein ABSC51_07635 [Gaiellaceae bacterium]|jgi:hypothetical protein